MAPNLLSRNITVFFKLKLGSFVLMRSPKRFYVGEVLDIYEKGGSGRYGSVVDAISTDRLSFLSLRVFLPLMIVSSFHLILYIQSFKSSASDTFR